MNYTRFEGRRFFFCKREMALACTCQGQDALAVDGSAKRAARRVVAEVAEAEVLGDSVFRVLGVGQCLAHFPSDPTLFVLFWRPVWPLGMLGVHPSET